MFRAYFASVLGVVLAGLLGACTTSAKGLAVPSDDSALGGGGSGAGDSGGNSGGVSGEGGGTRPMPGKCDRPEKQKASGVACGCDLECDSGKCVDGVCCSGACDGTCQACNVPGKMGACSPIPAGMAPVLAGQCKRDDVATCGSDGTCDGNGACRRYPDGTACEKGMCDGATIKGAKVCKTGKCEAGANTVCSPFNCSAATSQCFDGCKEDSECAKGQQCKNGSCGKKNLGAVCAGNTECDSGFCADGVCCNTTCNGACVSCNQLSKMGECSPVLKDQTDPHKVCKDEGTASCSTSGTCDGSGGCAKYGPTTTCREAKCEGANLLPASSCDGKGSCRAGNQVPCPPFSCVGNACKASCDSDNDCSGGNVCRNGTCGLRGKGQLCTANAQCGTTFCIDGVCCENACEGQCKFCASSQARGSCVNVAASTPDPRAAAGITDPTRVCLSQDKTSCGRNGMCSGNGGCQVWDSGTMCNAQTCATGTNTYSEAKMCDGFGMCKAQGSRTCAPYKCNGPACGNACGSDNDCIAPNACVAGKCGPKPNGGLCNNNNECSSQFCRQGVCCQTDCKGSCFSCSLSTSRGSCTAVPAGSNDPAGVCKDDGVSSCDRDSKCDGAGKCRLYANGQICAGATCAAGSATGISACNGTGDCVKGAVRMCGAFKCNAEGTACYESCVDNNQCVTGRFCQGSSCGKKANGAACPGGADECMSGQCSQGFCCNAKCDGICKSCGLQGKEGTCDNIPKGMPDLSARCVAQAPGTCGTDGFCDGAGACAKHGTAVPCRNQSCPADSTTQTLAATCDGAGSCPPVATKDCKLIKCDPSTTVNACLTSCSMDSQCVSSSFCEMMSCGGLKDAGTACTAHNQCKAGLKCVNDVCCGLPAGASACPVCQSCAAPGKPAGSCNSLAAGPNGSCPAGDCLVAACSANGTCAMQTEGRPCGTPSCDTTANAPKVFKCNASGVCEAAPVGASCAPYKCAAGACPLTCAMDTDCVSGNVCSGNKCMPPLKANGVACSGPGAGGECTSGNCVDNVCCGSACGAPCFSCNGSTPGTCTALAAGVDDTACSASCNYGKCGEGGACATLICNSKCSVDGSKEVGQSCPLVGSATNMMCVPSTDTPCGGGFRCVENTGCLKKCETDGECQAGFYCSGKKCEAKKAVGETCVMASECGSPGVCAQGVCCASACTGSCKTCAGSVRGTCSNVSAGGADPASMCVNDNVSICGTNGMCDGSGSCQKRTNTSCGQICSVDNGSVVPRSCDGTGMCVPGASTSCFGFLCAEPVATATGSAVCTSTPVVPPPTPPPVTPPSP